jgi:hypothetical protein
MGRRRPSRSTGAGFQLRHADAELRNATTLVAGEDPVAPNPRAVIFAKT